MENIDIIIVAGVSFLLVVGGLFFGMYFARRTEAARVARLEEREERLLAMRAKFEHERFAVSAATDGGNVELDEDLFRGIKEEIEQERMELDMRREELELDLRMLEEENDRLKSTVNPRTAGSSPDDDIADEAVIVEEVDEGSEFSPERFEDMGDVPIVEEVEDVEDAVFEEADEDVKARNTVFGEFFFEEDEPEIAVEEPPVAVDDGWSSEPDDLDNEPAVNVPLSEPVGGDGAAARDDEGERSEPARPAFDHMLTAEDERTVDQSIQQILGISASDLALMNDLGYGTFRSIADLTDEEVSRLAEAFDIPEERIRDEWIPDSRMRVAREPRA